MKKILVEGVGEVTLRKSRLAKRLILKIAADGKLVATLPAYVPYAAGILFVKQNRDWFIQNQPAQTPSLLNDGKSIGQSHVLQFEPSSGQQTVTSRVQGSTIRIIYPAALAITDSMVQAEAKKASIRALKKQAEASLPAKLYALAQRYNYNYREVRIKTVQTRWGSCSTNKIINLSVWLMQLPDPLIEYVICHELAHLSNMHHQPAFWEELGTMIPDYKVRRKQLKQYRPALM